MSLAALIATGCARQTPPMAAPPVAVPGPVLSTPVLASTPPSDAGMRAELNARLDSIMSTGIAEGAAPGGALVVGRYGKVVHRKGYGRLDTLATSAPVDASSSTTWRRSPR